MTYKVKLEIFEGPLDLLFYLIKKEELNIHDIPIAAVTEQYLQYMELMKMLDLDIAGEFLVMAATLMHIKSKMLLPPEESEASEEEIDPRDELVRKLLEYKKFKEAAGQLKSKEAESKETFTRSGSRQPIEDDPADEELYFEASIFDLLSAFSKILKEVPKNKFYEVIKDEVTVSGKIHEIFHMLVKRPVIYLLELFNKARNKLEIVATFLALLELIRMKEVLVKQDKVFGDIKIIRNTNRITPPNIEEEKNAGEEPDKDRAERAGDGPEPDPARDKEQRLSEGEASHGGGSSNSGSASPAERE